jgi:CRISPR-associated protein Csx10
MKALVLQLTLETPALFTGVSNGEENSSRSLPYIPGAALRGLLVARYIQKYQPGPDLLMDGTAKRLFFDGSVRFLNGYPVCDGTWRRGLPVPASWRKRKNDGMDGADARDFALEADEDFDTGIARAFTGIHDEKSVIVLNPEQQLLTHIGGEERGRVRKGNNSVFQYLSLAQGQSFVAVILAEEAALLETVRSLLEQDGCLPLGRSHAASYGRVRLEKSDIDEDWHEYEAGCPKDLTILTLLSDALLRDGSGQPTHDLDQYIEAKLEKPVRHLKTFVRPTVTGGFNRKWKLPLEQFPALGMGSVFVYDAHQVTEKDLEILASGGVGERQAEGFGRIAVNWQSQEIFSLREKDEQPKKQSAVPLCEDSKKLAAGMAERLLRRKLDSRLIEQAQYFSIKGAITNHQLARLRGVVRDAINQPGSDTGKVETFIQSLKPTALQQYEKPRVQKRQQGGMRLKDWLEERLSQKDGLAQMEFREADVKAVAGQMPDLAAYGREYTLRFIEAVIDRRMKEKE